MKAGHHHHHHHPLAALAHCSARHSFHIAWSCKIDHVAATAAVGGGGDGVRSGLGKEDGASIKVCAIRLADRPDLPPKKVNIRTTVAGGSTVPEHEYRQSSTNGCQVSKCSKYSSKASTRGAVVTSQASEVRG